MKDLEARADIEYLRHRIESLQSEVNTLRKNLDEQTNLESSADFLGSRSYFFPVADVVKLILTHLGLEVRYRAPMPSVVELWGTRKGSDSGSEK